MSVQLSPSYTGSVPSNSANFTSSPKAAFSCAVDIANGKQMVLHSLALIVRFTVTSTPVAFSGAVVDNSSRTTVCLATTLMLNTTAVPSSVPLIRILSIVTGYSPTAVPPGIVTLTVAASPSPLRALSEELMAPTTPPSLENIAAQSVVALTPLTLNVAGSSTSKCMDVIAVTPDTCSLN